MTADKTTLWGSGHRYSSQMVSHRKKMLYSCSAPTSVWTQWQAEVNTSCPSGKHKPASSTLFFNWSWTGSLWLYYKTTFWFAQVCKCNTGEWHLHTMLSLCSCFYDSFPIVYYSKPSLTLELVWPIALCCCYLISPFSVTFIPMGFLNTALLWVPVSLIFIWNATITAASLWSFTYWKGEWRPETDRCYKVW